MYKNLLLLAILAFAVIAPGYGAETFTLADLLSGKACPLSMKVKELTPQWYRFALDQKPAAGNGEAAMMLAVFEMLTQGGNVFYTQGRTVDCAGKTYLVAYGRQRKPLDPKVFENNAPPMPEPLTPDTSLSLSLLDVTTLGSLSDIRPVDLKAELTVDTQIQQFLAAEERKAKEATLTANLHQLRNAIAQFEADTGVYPAQLTDLTVPATNGTNAGKTVVPANSYKGPYFTPYGGINNTGIPVNPFVDITTNAPATKKIATHWKYDPVAGTVQVPDNMAAMTTARGDHYGDL